MSNWIRRSRMDKHMTMAELASYAGISRSHLCNIETGVSRPSLPVLYHLAMALDEGEFAAMIHPFLSAPPNPVAASQDETLF